MAYKRLGYCRFCKYYGPITREDKRRKVFFVECKTCGARGPVATDREMARWRWGEIPVDPLRG